MSEQTRRLGRTMVASHPWWEPEPVIDRLAAGGLRYTRTSTPRRRARRRAPRCSPDATTPSAGSLANYDLGETGKQ